MSFIHARKVGTNKKEKQEKCFFDEMFLPFWHLPNYLVFAIHQNINFLTFKKRLLLGSHGRFEFFFWMTNLCIAVVVEHKTLATLSKWFLQTA